MNGAPGNGGNGDSGPQLTLRAILTGGALGVFMSISNLYLSVKIGWSFGVAITACVLSVVFWNALRAASLGRLPAMSILENNCMQSTASAAGYSTGGMLGMAFGALLLTTGSHAPWYFVMPIIFLTAALGVFAAIPMKRQMIDIEQLPFPSGIAAAQTLRSLYSRSRDALQQAYALLLSLGGGAAVGVLRIQEGLLPWLDRVIASIRLPELIAIPARFSPIPDHPLAGFGFQPSALLVGAGMLMGLRVCLSMIGGAVLLYCVVTPILYQIDASHVGDPGYVPSRIMSPDGTILPPRWALWTGTAAMVFASLTSLALAWPAVARSFRFSAAARTGGAAAARDVPFAWFVAGMIPISIGMVALLHLAFNVSILLGVVSVAMTFVVALVCCRVTGETDTTPMGPAGKLTQLLFAVLAQGNTTVNLMSAGVTAGAGASAADLLTDLKCGHVLGACPRRQFLAQLAGVVFGTLAVVPAWYMMFPDAQRLEQLNPPATMMWVAVAQALTAGLDSIPPSARSAAVIGALVGVALPLLEARFPRAARFVPSATGLGFSWVMTFDSPLAFAAGAALAALWARLSRRSADRFAVPVASGLVAGESLAVALMAILAAFPSAISQLLAALGVGA